MWIDEIYKVSELNKEWIHLFWLTLSDCWVEKRAWLPYQEGAGIGGFWSWGNPL